VPNFPFIRLDHLVVQIVSLAGALADSREEGVSRIFRFCRNRQAHVLGERFEEWDAA